MDVTILGCGTSGGVPRIGGEWGDCDPGEPRNRRRRCSILVQSRGVNIIVDTSPDFREQCLDAGLSSLNAVLYTHEHADHVNGIDDLRAFRWIGGALVPAYGDARTMALLERRFDYIFHGSDGYPPICQGHIVEGPFEVDGLQVRPFRQHHGNIETLGFRFGDVAYSTDLNGLTDEARDVLQDLDVWIVDALRPQPHPTHTHLEQTLSWIKELRPRRAILTHMTWQMDYQTLVRTLPAGVEPAFDGMVIETADPARA
jgi:phosphoribosyl 1,2-cyclic phosphate phosphodiesterase